MRESKRSVINKVHKKLDGALTIRQVKHVVNLLVEQLKLKVLNDESISIDNFGTFEFKFRPSHKARHIVTGELIDTKPYKSVQFCPHHNFLKLLNERHLKFRNKNK